ncbi:MAG: F0F1 ATP synthase subunit gamma, partial [Candidatus Aminicenantes bacterium]|nr:F0F1 ATP synthase subunit gamma [Candidatus Aminicenantes bacterium]
MEQIQTLRRKIESAEDLHSVVKTMKVLAAVSIREYERAEESLREYGRTVERGLQILMRQKRRGAFRPSGSAPGHLGAVIFGSEQGMVGSFNDQIVSFALQNMDELGLPRARRHVLAVGERVMDRLEDRGEPVEDHVFLRETMMDLTSVVQVILIKIEEWRLRKGIDRIIVFANRPASRGTYRPTRHDLLPLDLEWLRELETRDWPGRGLPGFSMDWERLFSSLIRQTFFVSLFRAIVDSLASENSSRLAAMQAAEKNIEDRLGELRTRFQHQRQETITAELLDIVSGFEVLS